MTPQLSLVIPAYNEANRLSKSLPQLVDGLAADTEILVIDDGSTDGTAHVARRHLATWPKHSVISLPRNCGKGAAVRAGVVKARGDVIAFVDADMATDPRDLGSLVGALEGNDVAVGSRSLDSSVIHERRPHRSVMTRTFGILVASMMQLPMSDTQCGFKAFKGSVAKLLFHGSRVDRFAFDIELLNLAAHLGLRTQEVPVRWTDVAGSHVRPLRDAVQMVADVARTRRNWRVQPPMQGVLLPEVPLKTAASLIRPSIRNVDLLIGWQGGTAVLFPCVAPTVARRISGRLLASLKTYDPQVLSVEFNALFSPVSARAQGHREPVG